MPPKTDTLSKDDLFLLLESYKNSVEMNTLISQQLSTILETVQQCKEDNVNLESNLKEKIEAAIKEIEKIQNSSNVHDKEMIKGHGKILNRTNLLYVGMGSIIIALIMLVYQVIGKLDLIEKIAAHLGVS